MDEVIRIANESILPVASAQEGFVEWIVLTDPSTDKLISISLWESEDHMRAGEQSGYLQQELAKVVPSFTAPPVRESYEVHVHS